MVAKKPQNAKLLYRFDEGSAAMVDELGGKGSSLCEMTRLGLPVPPGFIVTTQACLNYFELGQRFPEGLWEGIQKGVHHLEKSQGKGFGSSYNPLLVSVRSGAK